MTKKAASPHHIKSFQELDSFLFKGNNKKEVDPVLLKKIFEGMSSINERHYENREKDINNFLQGIFDDSELSLTTDQQGLTWFDMNEYKSMIEAVNKDKDRSGTSSLKDLKVLKKPLVVEDFTIFNELETYLPNFKKVVNYYRGSFAMNKTKSADKYSSPRPVLLLGEAGIGKTVFANKLAKALNTNYNFLDSNSITSSWTLSGNNVTWRGAEAGLIFRAMSTCETISPVITLDEIDKLQSQKQNSPFSLFHQMFEKENARRFYDEFLKFYFDASNIIYVLTANNINSIPESLLSRMEVFDIDNPTPEHMRVISQGIYEKEINGSSFFIDKLNDNQLEVLSTYKPREVQKILSRSINNQLSKNIDCLDKKEQILILETEGKTKNNFGLI